jgi:isochorismate synthase
MSLAGTRQLDEMDPAQWNAKELEEQNVVSTYIDRLLEQAGVGNYKKNGPAITKAGLVTHLRTTFQFTEEGIKGKLGWFLKNLTTPSLVESLKNRSGKH